MRIWYSVVVVSVCLSSFTVNGLRCLRCSETTEPRLCNRIETCNTGEVCGVQVIRADNGDKTYWTGCVPSSDCTKTPSRNVLHTKRDSSSHPKGQVICEECCTGDLCNSEGCGTAGYPKARGPICFDCRDVYAPVDCHKIVPCNLDEDCLLEERTIFGQRYFTNRCEKKQACKTIGIFPFGKKRDASLACHKCCHGDLCNNNCTSGTYHVKGTTQSVPVPVLEAFHVHHENTIGTGTIKYQNISLNTGLSYDTTTGVFTCKSNSLYMFTWSSSSNNGQTRVALSVNGVIKGVARADPKARGIKDTSTAFAILDLNAGDRVKTIIQSGTTIGSFFAGWKINKKSSSEAFYTRLSQSYTTSKIPFTDTITNEHGHFSNSDSSFRAGTSGLYVLGFTGEVYNTDYDDLELHVNGVLRLKVFSDSDTSHYDTGSTLTVLHLNTGDRVTVEGQHMRTTETTLSGYLLSAGSGSTVPAFAASLNSDSPSSPVAFDTELTDSQHNYDIINGHFTCNVTGIYVFSWTIEANGISVLTSLKRSSKGHVTTEGTIVSQENKNDEYDSSTGIAILSLSVGDSVWVENPGANKVEGSFSSFSGWLISS